MTSFSVLPSKEQKGRKEFGGGKKENIVHCGGAGTTKRSKAWFVCEASVNRMYLYAMYIQYIYIYIHICIHMNMYKYVCSCFPIH